MKRPFAVVGLTYLIAQTIAMLCGFTVTTVLVCVAAACALFVFLRVKNRPEWLLPVLISCAVSFGFTCVYSAAAVHPAKALEGQNAYIIGRVTEAPYTSYGRTCYIIETDAVSLKDAPQTVRFRLSSSKELGANYGDTVRTEVQFNYMDSESEISRRLLAEGVVLTAYLPYDAEPEIRTGKPSIYGSIIGMRNTLSKAAVRLMGDELGGLLVGMLTGDTQGISTINLESFRDCGLSHLFAVSGLHLSILISVLLRLLRRITPNYRITSLLTIPFVVFLMAFSGFSMSIRRAGIMMLLYLSAQAVRREADGLNSLGFSALAVCVFNPFAAGDVGLLMSCSCTLGLVTLGEKACEKAYACLKLDHSSRSSFIIVPIVNTFVLSCIAAAFTFPITVTCFGETSLIGPIANTLCAAPISYFLTFGTAASALTCLPFAGDFLGFIFMLPAWFFGRLLLAVSSLLSALPGAGLLMNYPFMTAFLFLSALLLALWYYSFGKGTSKTRSLLICFALILAVFLSGAATYNVIGMTRETILVFSADNGIMTALISGRRCVIIGAGGDSYHCWLASDELASRNINETLAVVLPDNSDKYARSAADLIERCDPDTVLLSNEGSAYEMLLRACEESGAYATDIADALFSAKGNISIETLTDDNGMIWVWGECGDLTILVVPEGGDCLLLPEQFRKPSVAVIGSDDVVNVSRLSPTATIISAGEAENGKVSAVLGYRGVDNIFQTPHDGFIAITKSGNGIRVDDEH